MCRATAKIFDLCKWAAKSVRSGMAALVSESINRANVHPLYKKSFLDSEKVLKDK